MDEQPLASLSLTHVHYNPNDPISYLCAWLALVPQGLCVVYATLILANREVEIGLMFAGQLACEVLNLILKRLIREERPEQLRGKGYGMPSSHSQFVVFFSITLVLFLLIRHSPRATAVCTPLPYPVRVLLSIFALIGAAAVAWSRVYLNYHTPKQVFVGSAAGAIFAFVWFLFTTWLRKSGWLYWGIDLPPARMLRIRDLVITEDLADAGWERWECKRRREKEGTQGGPFNLNGKAKGL